MRVLIGGSYPGNDHPRVVLKTFPASGFLTQDCETLITIQRLLYSKPTFEHFRNQGNILPIPFDEDMFNSTKKLVIGYCDYDGVMETVPSMKRAISIAKKALEAKGHKLVAWKPDHIKEMLMTYFRAMSVDGAPSTVTDLANDIEISYPNKLSYQSLVAPFWLKWIISYITMPLLGQLPGESARQLKPGKNPNDCNLVYKILVDYQKKFTDEFHAHKFDALLWPSFPCPSVPLDLPRDMLGAISYTGLFNLMDWPAGVNPVTTVNKDDCLKMEQYPKNDMFHRAIYKGNKDEDAIGLPVAVQIAAPRYCEELVLRLMLELENELKNE